MKLKSFPGRYWIEFQFLRLLIGFFCLLSIESATRFSSWIGDRLYALLPKRRKIILENLEKAFPGGHLAAWREKTARASFRHLMISLMEFFRLEKILPDAQTRFEFEGTEVLDEAFKQGKGIIFTISHLGSWEYLAFLPYLKRYPCSVIVRETRNPYIFKWIQALRDKTGLHPIHRQKSMKLTLQKLKHNELVAILIDQWAGPSGLWGKFFDHPTSTTVIPARLASHTGAALIPGYCLRLSPGHYKIIIRPQVVFDSQQQDSERKITERLNFLLEEEIRRWPEQWIWGHRRWKPIGRYQANQEKQPPQEASS